MSYQSHWRDVAGPIITRVIEENKGKPEKEVRTALRLAYPFGERKYHPYKIWCNEVHRQLGGGRGGVIIDPSEVRTAFLGERKW